MEEVEEIWENHLQTYIPPDPSDSFVLITSRKLAKINFDKYTEPLLDKVNDLLSQKITSATSLMELQKYVFCGGKTVIELCQRNNIPVYPQTGVPKKFPFAKKPQKADSQKSPSTEEKETFVSSEKEHSSSSIEEEQSFSSVEEKQKSSLSEEDQKLKAEQQKLFQYSPKIFRKLLFAKHFVFRCKEPTHEDVETYWSELWEKEGNYDHGKASTYIKQERDRMIGKEKQKSEDVRVSRRELDRILHKKKNWSSPGIDGVQAFWYKRFEAIRRVLLRGINDVIQNPGQMPPFFTTGYTELLYFKASKKKAKKEEGGEGEGELAGEGEGAGEEAGEGNTQKTKHPSKYRPITYLPALYKIITACINRKIADHYEKNGVLADEQCGARKGCLGVRKALIIDSVALGQAEVFGWYLDFRKAFDMVSHSWVLTMLEIYGLHDTLINFIAENMKNWKTRVYLEPDIFTRTIRFKRGVFQGDCTSVILYETSINALSFALNKQNLGLALRNGGCVTHVLYMDDLKLYSSNPENLQKSYDIVKHFADATSIEVNEVKSRRFKIPSDEPVNHDEIKYSYLGHIQTPKLNHVKIVYHKSRLFNDKLKKLENTFLGDVDKASVKLILVNKLYNSFGIISWKLFKGELLKVKTGNKVISEFIKTEGEGMEDIYLEMLQVICDLRKSFFAQRSYLMRDIIQNDTVTPLMLSKNDDKDCIRVLVEGFKEEKQKQKDKRKAKRKKNRGKKGKRGKLARERKMRSLLEH